MSSYFNLEKKGLSRIHLRNYLKTGSILLLILILGLAAYGPKTARAVSPPPTTCTTSGDFEFVVDPIHLVLLPGGSATPLLTATPIDGFTGIVTLTIKNLASGLTASLSKPSLDLSTGPQTATLTVGTSSTIATGMTYTLDVNATTTGSVFHKEIVSVFVPAPELGIWPDSYTMSVVAGGSSGTDMINVQALYGLADASATLTATISSPPPASTPPSVSIPSPVTIGTTATKTPLTVSTTSATTPGYYLVEVLGSTPTAVANSTSVFLQVIGPGFSLSLSPEHLIMASSATKDSTITVSSIDGFTSPSVSITVFSSPFPPGGPSATLASPTVSLTSSAPTATDVISVTTASTPPGLYSIIVTGMSGSISNETFVEVIVPGPGFSMDASPSSLTLSKGASTPSTSIISLSSELSFAGTVNLSIACYPAGLNAMISPTSVALTSSGTGTATLSVSTYSFTTPGLYGVVIDGLSTSPSASNSTVVLVTVTSGGSGDFGVALSTGAMSITQGSSDTATLTATWTGGFTGTVLLTSSVSPAGPTVTFSPNSLSVGYGTSTITVNVGPSVTVGTYHITITGTSGLLMHTQLLDISVTAAGSPDFGASLSTDTLSIKQGDSGSSTITISPVNGFADTVSLTGTVSPSGPTVSFSRTSLYTGYWTSTMTVNVGSNVAPGTYTVTITATSGYGSTARSHVKTESVTVTSASTQSTSSVPTNQIFGLDPIVFYAAVGGIIAVIAIAGVVVVLRARKPQTLTP